MVVLAGTLLLAPVCYAADPELDRPILQAKQVLKEIMASPDQNIPEELLARCKAIVIYPNLITGGFILGGRYGKGVVLRRDKATGKWGSVAFSTITGTSVGFQAGIQATDLILVIMNNKGIESLLKNKFTLGVTGAVSVGPVGRTAEMATDISLRAGILAYSRSRGLFGGVALGVAVVTPDNKANAEYYGRPVTPREILFGEGVAIQASSRELVAALTEYSQRWDKRIHSMAPSPAVVRKKKSSKPSTNFR